MRCIHFCVMLVLLIAPIEKPVSAGSWVYVSLLEEKQIVTFSRDTGTGLLTRGVTTECPAEPAALAVSPDRRFLYASLRSTSELAAFRIDQATGGLNLINVVSAGKDPAYLLPDSTGRFLLSAYYVSNMVTVHQLAADGSLSDQPLQAVATAQNAHGIAMDSNNRHTFVTHTGANRIYQFKFDAVSGALTPNEAPFITTPEKNHPRHISMHPSDRWAYVSNESGDSLSVYSVNRNEGTLQPVQTLSTLPDGYDGSRNSTARCEITKSGRFVYVANRGHDSIACFAIDQTTGKVTSLGQTPTEQTPRSFTITADSRFLYAAGQGSGRLAAFRILTNGKLERFATYDSGPVSWWAMAVEGQ